METERTQSLAAADEELREASVDLQRAEGRYHAAILARIALRELLRSAA
jgi:hypothetical protein